MKIFIFLLSVIFFTPQMTYAGQFNFDFKKSIFFNRYALVISNEDPNRSISFSGCYSEPMGETSYYLIMNNGSKKYFDSKKFCQIGMKGRYWINSSQRGEIPFKIQKNIINNAKKIIFRGVVFIPVTKDGVVHLDDSRELKVTYDIESGNISYNVSDRK